METYLVGGAVRDMLMGKDPKDKDYVVTGATVQDMLDKGFKQVGADFPVFLHPETGDEYALARVERKVGEGYHGFETTHDSNVSLEDDLKRRDLTINSIAAKETEENYWLKDPFYGYNDLMNKVLRHTSEAFEEDPVRVLRVARFRARFGPEWTVAPETTQLMAKMAKRGDLEHLTAERVWKEMSRALMEDHPRLFFDTLLEADALHSVFPEIYRLKTALESRRWHPEGDAYEHTMLVLTQAALQGFDLGSRYASLVHDFGKGVTPRDKLPKHYGHDVNGVEVVEKFSNRLTVPAKVRDRAMKATRYHMNMHKLDTLNPKTLVKMFNDMGAQNDAQVVHVLHDVGCADHRGRLGSEEECIEHLGKLFAFFNAWRSVRFVDVFLNGETSVNKIKDGMFRAQVKAVKDVK